VQIKNEYNNIILFNVIFLFLFSFRIASVQIDYHGNDHWLRKAQPKFVESNSSEPGAAPLLYQL
jgi:hypothetical protein